MNYTKKESGTPGVYDVFIEVRSEHDNDPIFEGCLKHLFRVNEIVDDLYFNQAPKAEKGKVRSNNFYPNDLTQREKEEIGELFDDGEPTKLKSEWADPYSIIRRDQTGKLEQVSMRKLYAAEMDEAAQELKKASEYASRFDGGAPAFCAYLEAAADAFEKNTIESWKNASTNWLTFCNELDSPIFVQVAPTETHLDPYDVRNAWQMVVGIVQDNRTKEAQTLIPELLLFNESLRDISGFEDYKEEFNVKGDALPVYSVVFEIVVMGGAVLDKHWQAVALPNEEDVKSKHGAAQLFYANVMASRNRELILPLVPHVLPETDIDFDYLTEHIESGVELVTLFHESSHNLPFAFVDEKIGAIQSVLEEGKADVFGMLFLNYLSKKEGAEFKVPPLRKILKALFIHYIRRIRSDSASRHSDGARIVLNWFIDQGALCITDDGKLDFNDDKIEYALQSVCANYYRLYEAIQYDKHGGLTMVHEFVRKWVSELPELKRLTDNILKLPITADINTYFVRPDVKN